MKLVDPAGIVEGPQDERLDVDEAGGVLPASGLVAPDEAAQDAVVADGVVGPADRHRVEPRHGHVLLDEPDVVVVLDQVLGDPRRHPVALGRVSQCPPRRGDGVPGHPVIGIGAEDLGIVPPLGGRELGEVGVREPELAHVLEVLDGCVQPEQAEGLEVADASEERVEMVLLPLVDGHGQAIGLLPGQGAEHPLFGGHGRIILRGAVNN
jgi:hypothetical protein